MFSSCCILLYWLDELCDRKRYQTFLFKFRATTLSLKLRKKKNKENEREISQARKEFKESMGKTEKYILHRGWRLLRQESRLCNPKWGGKNMIPGSLGCLSQMMILCYSIPWKRQNLMPVPPGYGTSLPLWQWRRYINSWGKALTNTNLYHGNPFCQKNSYTKVRVCKSFFLSTLIYFSKHHSDSHEEKNRLHQSQQLIKEEGKYLETSFQMYRSTKYLLT